MHKEPRPSATTRFSSAVRAFRHRLQFDIYGIMSFMNEDDRDFTDLDPANLLPFECVFEPENPAIRIRSTYIPSEPLAPVDNGLFFP
jgi:hypothetical protein